MAFEGLSEKLSATFKRLRSRGRLTEADVKDVMREVRLALLEADVNYKVAKDFTNRVGEKCIGENITESLTPAQTVIKIVNSELTELMGGEQARLNRASKGPTVIMFCGLQGSGKTTHAAKIAKLLRSKGNRPLLAACDIYRPAAIDQLKIVAEKAGVPVFEKGTQNPVKTAKQAYEWAKDYGNDYLLIDTAGRLHIDEELMNELREMKKAVPPDDILLVVDAMTGQDAVNVAESFNEALNITGVVITKLDGDTRGGAALSVKAVTGCPIKFAGTGEKLDDIEEFHPERMASRILGMGDVMSLIEQAEAKLDEKKAEETARRLQQNKFDLNDMLFQFEEIHKIGSVKKLVSMMPGMGSKIREEDIDERRFDRIEAIIKSMTPKERAKPDIINPSRKRRIAAGSGTKVEDVNMLLRQYEQIKKMFRQIGGKKGRKNLSRMKLPPGFNF